MQFAVELGHSSKNYFTMVCNRLEVIAHEDIGLADPQVVMFVATAMEQAKRHYSPDKPGKWRMMMGNAIRLMCRADKSREGDHFQAALGLPNMWKKGAPEVPDWAHDKHTFAGRKQKRGLTHFREEATLLINGDGTTPEPDAYEDEAYEQWRIKEGGTQHHIERDMFGDPVTSTESAPVRRRRTVKPAE